jgi:hypothetical protein
MNYLFHLIIKKMKIIRSQSIKNTYMHSMHYLTIAAGGIRTALFSSGPPSLSYSGPKEMPGLPNFRGRLSLNAQTRSTTFFRIFSRNMQALGNVAPKRENGRWIIIIVSFLLAATQVPPFPLFKAWDKKFVFEIFCQSRFSPLTWQPGHVPSMKVH